ncbi:MAG: hypothetical protein WCO84_05430 [bacterium]
MSENNLVTCPLCKAEECCTITPLNEFHNNYTCINCGFETNDLMREGEFDFEEYEAPAEFPQLYKDIKQTDDDGRVWYPMTINIKKKGIVYAFGTNVENWQWRSTKSIPLTAAELLMPKFRNQTYKSDPSTTKDFGNDFFEAADHINLFDY